MGKSNCPVAVCSRSFSRDKYLREQLLNRYDNVKFNDEGLDLRGSHLIEYLRGYEKVIIGLETINEEVLDQLPNLKVIAKYGVGIDKLDLQAMRDRNIKLGWTPGVNKRSVSELVVSMSIFLLRRLGEANSNLKKGIWKQLIGNLLSNKTVGIIGLGNVGQDLVKLLAPFQCRIIANDILDKSDFCRQNGVKQVALESIFSESDIVTLHTPYDSSTANMVSNKELAAMKQHSVLLNFARGGIVDESALITALNSGNIFAAAMDVFAFEPLDNDELLNCPNFFASPHLGGSAAEAVKAMGEAAIEGLDEFYEY